MTEALIRVYRPAAFAWGVAEATLFFIVPDVLIGLIALHRLRHGLLSALWSTAGAIVGGSVVFAFPQAFQSVFPAVPGSDRAMMAEAARRFGADGWWAVIAAPASGIPYKLYAAEFALRGSSLVALVAVTAVARSWRFLGVALVCGAIGWRFGVVRAHPRRWLAAYVAFWIAVYAVYYLSLTTR